MNENINMTPPKKKRASRRRKFNIIDFLLVLLLLVLIAALVYVFLPMSVFRGLGAGTGTDIRYSIEILGVDEQFLDDIKENDTVIDSVTKNTIGTVTAVDYGIQYTELKYDQENSVGVMSPVAGKYNVIVTISANADFEEGEGYMIGGTRIAVGEKISARFPGYACEAYCISVPRD